MELGPPYLPSLPDFLILWPELEIGQTATESCACGSLDPTGYVATRMCTGSYSEGAMWEDQDVSNCSFSSSVIELCQASEVRLYIS